MANWLHQLRLVERILYFSGFMPLQYDCSTHRSRRAGVVFVAGREQADDWIAGACWLNGVVLARHSDSASRNTGNRFNLWRT
jgi:hypothetical protein